MPAFPTTYEPASPTPPVYPVFPLPGRTPRFVIRRRLLQGVLYLLTAVTTFSTGVVGWEPLVLGVDADVAGGLAEHGLRGLVYMVAVLAVLTAHEAGHFIAATVHRIPATLPFFLPVPVLLTGTLGAVIGMEGSRATRRELFDIAIAGPLAGLAIAIPALAAGMAWAEPSAESLFGLPRSATLKKEGPRDVPKHARPQAYRRPADRAALRGAGRRPRACRRRGR